MDFPSHNQKLSLNVSKDDQFSLECSLLCIHFDNEYEHKQPIAHQGETSMADRTGEQLANYRIIRLIGRGGFAEVYLAEHLYLRTQVAIKILNTQLTNEDMEGFLQEARTIAHLVHPHIVRVLDFGTHGETPFLVMDYAANGTLRQRHPKGTKPPLPTIVGYVKQIASALQYAHDQ